MAAVDGGCVIWEGGILENIDHVRFLLPIRFGDDIWGTKFRTSARLIEIWIIEEDPLPLAWRRQGD